MGRKRIPGHLRYVDNKQTKLYTFWCSVKVRCYCVNAGNFKHYGGRGIKMCDSWKNNFNAFADFVLNAGWKPGIGLSIDRVDNDGDYCPENCRIVPLVEQQTGKRFTEACALRSKKAVAAMLASTRKPVRCIETGETFPSASAASRHLGFNPSKVRCAIARSGTSGGFHWEYV